MHFNSSKKLVFNDGIMNWNVLKLTFHAKIKRNRHVLKIKNYSTLRKDTVPIWRALPISYMKRLKEKRNSYF